MEPTPHSPLATPSARARASAARSARHPAQPTPRAPPPSRRARMSAPTPSPRRSQRSLISAGDFARPSLGHARLDPPRRPISSTPRPSGNPIPKPWPPTNPNPPPPLAPPRWFPCTAAATPSRRSAGFVHPWSCARAPPRRQELPRASCRPPRPRQSLPRELRSKSAAGLLRRAPCATTLTKPKAR